MATSKKKTQGTRRDTTTIRDRRVTPERAKQLVTKHQKLLALLAPYDSPIEPAQSTLKR